MFTKKYILPYLDTVWKNVKYGPFSCTEYGVQLLRKLKPSKC